MHTHASVQQLAPRPDMHARTLTIDVALLALHVEQVLQLDQVWSGLAHTNWMASMRLTDTASPMTLEMTATVAVGSGVGLPAS